MPKSLVIVESPAKARTIERYLGQGYAVRASMGHVRDLPKRTLGVDIEKDFAPTYTVLPDRRKALAALKKAVGSAETVFMATDLDREGEAIAWHLCEALGLDPAEVQRVVFNEITRGAIQAAFHAPRRIDMNKVSAQEARRILDRLVGYTLSPLLWRKVAKGLSAGRVQSVAVRLVVEREREVRAFEPEEFWKITARLSKAGREETFEADLAEVNGEPFRASRGEEARALGRALRGAAYRVRSAERRRAAQAPPPPFTTSELQRAAASHLGFSTRRTMVLAQALYQGVDLGPEGPVALITYMRTDSHHVAASAQQAARAYLGQRLGEAYLPAEPPVYASRGRAQEAHEAIRPTDPARTPETVRPGLQRDQARLYELIWNRFLASQMKPAEWDVTDLEVEAAAGETVGLFKVRGRVLVFDGFTRVAGLRKSKEEQQLPDLAPGEPLDLRDLLESQHFTPAPARYTEATLVRQLEKLGIGRPSTYAPIVTTIQDRGYVTKAPRQYLACGAGPPCPYTSECGLAGRPVNPAHAAERCPNCGAPRRLKEGVRSLYATELGEVVTDKLVGHFPRIMDVAFTSHMEDELDDVEEAKMSWLKVMREFWEPFSEALEKAKQEMTSAKHDVPEDAGPCPECGSPLRKRWSKRGPFLGCSKYPECKFTRPLEGEAQPRPEPKATEHACPKCGGRMMLRTGRRGPFLGCENYPKCRSTMPCDAEGNPVAPQPTGQTCEKCGSPMVVRQGRRGPFLGCSAYPKCRSTRPLPGEGEAPESGNAKGAAAPAADEGHGGPPPAAPKPTGQAATASERRPEGPALRAAKGRRDADPPRAAPRPKPQVTDQVCPDCGKPMVIRSGRRGRFLGCSGYPQCRHTEDLPDTLA